MAAKERWHRLVLVHFSTDLMRAWQKAKDFFPLRGVISSLGVAYHFRCIVIKTFRSLEVLSEHLGPSSAICMRHFWFCLIV